MLYCASLAAQQQLLTASLLRTGSFFFLFFKSCCRVLESAKELDIRKKRRRGEKCQPTPPGHFSAFFIFILPGSFYPLILWRPSSGGKATFFYYVLQFGGPVIILFRPSRLEGRER